MYKNRSDYPGSYLQIVRPVPRQGELEHKNKPVLSAKRLVSCDASAASRQLYLHVRAHLVVNLTP